MRLTRSVNLILDSALSLLYPQRCALCGCLVEQRADGIVCADCWSETRVFSPSEPICFKCGRPTIKPVVVEQLETIRCGICEIDSYSAVRTCGFYEGALKTTVLTLKREPHLCRHLVDTLCEIQRTAPLVRATLIMPVPLHPTREKMRGFNQARVIAYEVARRAGIPLNDSNLIRVAQSDRYRAGMDRRGRRDTVQDVFGVVHPALVGGERVLLIDDVYTTGATLSACSTVLLEAGAKEVLALTIARAK